MCIRDSNYINVFDGSCRFFRGKRSDGNWETPFNPYEAGRSYTEASAWQYRFFVPHDVNGMIQLFGGEEQFLQDLDSLFSTTSVVETSLSDITLSLIHIFTEGKREFGTYIRLKSGEIKDRCQFPESFQSE